MDVHRMGVAATLLVASCQDPNETALGAPSAGDSTSAHETDDEAEPPPDDDADDEELAGDCATKRHVATDPRVLFDVEIACGHTMFGAYGVSVAGGADRAYVAVSAFYEGLVFEIDDDDVAALAGAPSWPQQRAVLTLDSDARLVMAGTPDDADGAVMIATHDGAWTIDELTPGGPEHRVPLDLDADADGNVLLGGSALQADWRARRQGGAWSIETMPWIYERGETRMALTSDGRTLAVVGGRSDHDAPWTTDVVIGDAEARPIGIAVDVEPSLAIPVAASTMRQPEDVPQTVVVTGHADGIAIDWIGPEGDGRVLLPDTAQRVDPCPEPEDPWNGCPELCDDRSRGIELGAFATARTEDGVTWVAAVLSEMDRRVGYDYVCDELKGNCSCDGFHEERGSAQSLRLFAVDARGQVRMAYAHALAGTAAWGSPAVDVHASGTRLTISVIAESTVSNETNRAVRTIAFETSPHDRTKQ
ncbi:MAG: hypothetical protein IAG13_28255 [Deltaproteobacteria bacterium]|nr:hypothetical protein [Nannocystaceae bacterium]